MKNYTHRILQSYTNCFRSMLNKHGIGLPDARVLKIQNTDAYEETLHSFISYSGVFFLFKERFKPNLPIS